jgi:hypothetical protein
MKSSLTPCAIASAAVVLAFAVAGCGGSDSGSSADSTGSTTAASQKNVRMTNAAWADYVAVRTEARTVNNKAIATFSTCRGLIFSSAPPEKVNACLGDSASSVVTTGKKTLHELDTFAADVAGECAKANETLAGNVKLYVASIQTVETSVSNGNVHGAEPHITNALEALKHTKTSSAAFDTACKPVA